MVFICLGRLGRHQAGKQGEAAGVYYNKLDTRALVWDTGPQASGLQTLNCSLAIT